MYRLTLTATLLRTAQIHLRTLSEPLELPLGVHRRGDGVEFLAPTSVAGSDVGELPRLRIAAFPELLRGASHLYWHGFALPQVDTPRIDLALLERGGCSAAVLCAGAADALDAVQIAGTRMEMWVPGRLGRNEAGVALERGAFSRYVGALGSAGAHARLRGLGAAVIGTSRLGSSLALALAKAGVRSITLIDGDRVEAHHLDAMEVAGASAVGKPKVEAVAELLAEAAPECEVRTVLAPLEEPRALRAALEHPVLVTAPDRGAPRLLASLCAVAHHRVHLDVGTGVFGEGDKWQAGADVRLVLPGQGCLLCIGGLDLERRVEVDWQRERAGSLRSLNAMAAGHAMFLLERLITGDLTESTWSRFVLDRSGRLSVMQPAFTVRPDCPLCANSGIGDRVWRVRR